MKSITFTVGTYHDMVALKWRINGKNITRIISDCDAADQYEEILREIQWIAEDYQRTPKIRSTKLWERIKKEAEEFLSNCQTLTVNVG